MKHSFCMEPQEDFICYCFSPEEIIEPCDKADLALQNWAGIPVAPVMPSLFYVLTLSATKALSAGFSLTIFGFILFAILWQLREKKRKVSEWNAIQSKGTVWEDEKNSET